MPGRTRRAKTCLITVWTAPVVRDKVDVQPQPFGKSRLAVVRALIVRTTLADLPPWWKALSEGEQQVVEDVEG